MTIETVWKVLEGGWIKKHGTPPKDAHILFATSNIEEAANRLGKLKGRDTKKIQRVAYLSGDLIYAVEEVKPKQPKQRE